MRGCEPSGDPRAVSVRGKGRSLQSVRNRPLFWWGKKKFLLLSRLPSFGRERPLVVVRAPSTSNYFLLVYLAGKCGTICV
jgi:hypothetical protein